MITMRIRTRIISYVFFSCFAVIILLSAYMYEEMEEVIIKTLDTRIVDINSGLSQLISEEGKPIAETLSEDEYADVYILISQGDETYRSLVAKRYDVPATISSKFTAAVDNVENPSAEPDDFRFVTSTIMHNDIQLKVLTGISLDNIQDDLDDMFVSVSVSAVIALLAVGILGVFISNSILRPVKEIIEASGNINSRNMSSRIKVPATRDEIYDLTVTLNSLFDRLEKSFNLQKEFIANISHEIKTPLTVMNLTTDEALQSAAEDDKGTRYYLKIYNNLNRINKLVKDIINLSYIETNQLASVEDVQIDDMVDEILDNFSEMILDKNIIVNKAFNGRCVIKGEPRLIYSAVMNLIHNAVKYNVKGGYINVSISDTEDGTEFSIKNSCRQ